MPTTNTYVPAYPSAGSGSSVTNPSTGFRASIDAVLNQVPTGPGSHGAFLTNYVPREGLYVATAVRVGEHFQVAVYVKHTLKHGDKPEPGVSLKYTF